jgi:hypothetical protein
LNALQLTALLDVYNRSGAAIRPSMARSLCSLDLIAPKEGVKLCDDGAVTWDARLHPSIEVTSDFFIPTSRGSALVYAMRCLPLPQPETVSETRWAIPGTDFEFAESEL